MLSGLAATASVRLVYLIKQINRHMNIPRKFLFIIFAVLVMALAITVVTTDWRLILILTALVPVIVAFQTFGILKLPPEQQTTSRHDDWYEKN